MIFHAFLWPDLWVLPGYTHSTMATLGVLTRMMTLWASIAETIAVDRNPASLHTYDHD